MVYNSIVLPLRNNIKEPRWVPFYPMFYTVQSLIKVQQALVGTVYLYQASSKTKHLEGRRAKKRQTIAEF